MNPERKKILEQIGKPGAVLCLFTSTEQMGTITDGCFGEEGEFFIGKVKEYAERIEKMPKTYEQDGKGDEAIAYLHYFIGGCDWYITEKDKEAGAQLQAFGIARVSADHFEWGYINIDEIGKCGAELDLHFTPCTIGEIRKEHDRRDRREEPQPSEDAQPLDETTMNEIAAAFGNKEAQ